MSRYTVHLRGLPWSATENDIRSFFRGLRIDDESNERNPAIRLIYLKNGKASGEAEVRFANERDYQAALKRNKEHMGSRYIEVFELNELRGGGPNSSNSRRRSFDDTAAPDTSFSEPIVRLRGLPFSCTKRDIESFFHGLQIAPNGITLAAEFGAKRSGEAFVQFNNMDSAYRALDRHKREIGHRYIEVFRSSIDEAKNFIFGGLLNSFKSIYGSDSASSSMPNLNDVITSASVTYEPHAEPATRRNDEARTNDFHPVKKRKFEENKYDSGVKKSRSEASYSSTSSNVIRMRGLPFNTREDDIYHFFQPLRPVSVLIKINPRDRRPTGEADVTFASYDDTMRALKYDRKNMNSRYIELFHDSLRTSERRTGPHSPPPSPPHPTMTNRYDERDSRPYSSGFQAQKPYYNNPPSSSSPYNSKPPQSFSSSYNSTSRRHPMPSNSPPAPPARPPSPPKLPVKPSTQIYPPYQSKFSSANQTLPTNDISNFQNNYTPFGPLNRSTPLSVPLQMPPSVPPAQIPKQSVPYLSSNPYTSFVANNNKSNTNMPPLVPMQPQIAPTASYKGFNNRSGAYQSNMNQSKFSY